MCVTKNEEALRIEPHFAECYGNMANAWKVSKLIMITVMELTILPLCAVGRFHTLYRMNRASFLCRRRETLTLQFATI